MTSAVERVKFFLDRVAESARPNRYAVVNQDEGGWEMVRLDDLRELVADAAKAPSPAINDIITERQRQIAVEGFDSACDDANARHELAARRRVMPPRRLFRPSVSGIFSMPSCAPGRGMIAGGSRMVHAATLLRPGP
jgi:hypothetical protein